MDIKPEGLVGTNGGSVGGGSAVSSPTSARRKRNRSIAGLDSSPGSADGDDGDEGQDDRRRQPGVKRACNECRQQKLRCDVVQEPFSVCSRCRRLHLECKIESNFKRVGKRSKNAEMEREIVELRRQLASQNQASHGNGIPTVSAPVDIPQDPQLYQAPVQQELYMSSLGSQEAVAGLLDLSGAYGRSPDGRALGLKKLEDVVLSQDRIRELFNHFFAFHHPFLPILDPEKSSDYYYDLSPLLFWSIISVAARRYTLEPNLLDSLVGPLSRLVWATIADLPHVYHVAKALCLLCTWPLPISSTSNDPTFLLSGLMMQMCMQIGLHRPSHAQDFSKFRVELREEEIRDRVKTWAACNITCQCVGTGYGQPPSTLYDWTLATESKDTSYRLPEELRGRLLIEKFSDKVTKALYSSRRDPVGITSDGERANIIALLVRDLDELQENLRINVSPINSLHLRAAALHLRLSAFFDSPATKHYRDDLLGLYFATTAFLECALNLETPGTGGVLTYASNYILQMVVAAGFTLLKLLNSFFAGLIDRDYGRALFNKTIWAIRAISVRGNDLPSRLAEVLAQLWKGGGAGTKGTGIGNGDVDGTLQLKVRCRMSMSLVFDSVWRWREEFQANGRGNLESALKNPTNPDSAAESSASSTIESSLAVPSTMISGVNGAMNSRAMSLGGSGMISGAVTPGPSNTFGEANYEVFDPLNWMLDGFVDFPYSFPAVQGLEAQGMA
ncbi:MAG: hypothetical protein M1812_006731 [Candelaria pacifica]|nr:MAG: hypothetical protein M1812_006731 [Candelaria pacifica]